MIVILFVLVSTLIKDLSRAQNCPFDVAVSSKDSTIIQSLNYSLEKNTKECESQLPNNSTLFSACEKDVLVLKFSSVPFIPTNENILPYVNLNISIDINVPSTRVFLQFECIQAPDFEDSYCHNHTTQIKNWGRMIWPCRALQIKNGENKTMPFHYTYACFRMFGLSQYRVNITIMPQDCRMSYLVTIPRYPQVDFRIRQFYDRASTLTSSPWSPIVAVDTNSENEVIITFDRPQHKLHVDISISIFQRDDDRLKEILTTTVRGPESSYIWSDVHAGDYVVFVYVDTPDCDLDCGEKDAKICQNCPHTMLNFTVHENKFTHPYSLWNFLANVGKVISILLFVLVLISALVVAGFLVYYRIIRPRRLARRPPRNIELVSRPSVLLLYTDDCAEHSNVVMSVANVLRRHANANVHIDQLDLIDPSVKPSLWLMNRLSDSQFILLVFSDATNRVMSGEQLVQRRPFPDLFSTAIQVIISRMNEITSTQSAISNGTSTIDNALNRFLVARISYSSPQVIPEFFSHLKCPHFALPDNIGALLGHLHGIRAEDGQIEHQADLTELTQTMESYRIFVEANPSWLEERFVVKEEEEPEPFVSVAEKLPLKAVKEGIDFEDHRAQAEAYGLLPFDEEDEDEGRNHMKKKAQHICTTCGEIFQDYKLLRSHATKSHPVVHNCSVCGHVSKRISELKKYQENQHEHECSTCLRSYKNRLQLKKRISSVHTKPYVRTKSYPCTFEGCSRAFEAPCLLEDHINMHNGDLKYNCDRCQKQFFSRAQYGVLLKKYHLISLREVKSIVRRIGDILENSTENSQDNLVDNQQVSMEIREETNEYLSPKSAREGIVE